MSWGSTAFTPIVTRNEPPFGFHEVITPPDFKVNNQNPWTTGDRVKREIQDKLKMQEYRKKLNTTNKSDFELGYDMDYDHARNLRCSSNLEQFMSGSIFGTKFTTNVALFIIITLAMFAFYRYKLSIGF